MESSSDDSFVWANASSDSGDSDSMAGEDIIQNCDEESESGKHYKKKLQKQLFDNEKNDSNGDKVRPKSKKRKIKEESTENDSPKIKRIKTEPESDSGIKNRPQCEKSLNGTMDEVFDASYLNKHVKEEQATFATPSSKKKKKKEKRESVMSSDLDDQYSESSDNMKPKKSKKHKRNVDPDTTDEGILNGAVESIYENHEIHVTENANMSTSKKKKLKKQKGEPSVEDENVDMIIEDKFSAEETMIQIPHGRDHKRETYNERSKNSSKSNESIPTQKIQDDCLSIHDNKISEIVHDDSSDESSTVQDTDVRQMSTHNSILHNNTTISTDNNKVNINDKNDNSYTNSHSNSCANSDFTLKTSTRTTRISDRIRFEEDEDSEVESSQIHNDDDPTQSSRFKRFVTSNPNLKPILPKTQCLITNDDENWILKCPSGLSIEALKDTDLVIDTKCKVKVKGQTYEGCFNGNVNKVTLVSYENNKFGMYNIPLNGAVSFRKRIPKPHFVQDNVMVNNQTNFIPLPETKCRHPLFGPHYKSAMRLPTVVKEQLKACNEPIQAHSERRRKKHKREKERDLEAEPVPSGRNKKKKRKHSYDEEVPPVKCKRPKREPSSTEVWESEKAIEETLFN